MSIPLSKRELKYVFNRLKDEHRIIKKNMRMLYDMGLTSQEGKDTFQGMKNYWLVHLEKEDRLIYPLLKEKIKESRELKNFLEEFEDEISRISRLIRELDKNLEKGEGDFDVDFEYIYVLITFRSTVEEEVIFKDFGDILKTLSNLHEFKEESTEF